MPQGRPFWVVDGRAYDFTEWMGKHPGGATWFKQTEGRDISALLHTYHREPARLSATTASYFADFVSKEQPALADKLKAPVGYSFRGKEWIESLGIAVQAKPQFASRLRRQNSRCRQGHYGRSCTYSHVVPPDTAKCSAPTINTTAKAGARIHGDSATL